MSSRLAAISIGAAAPHDLARFWAGVLGRETADDPDGAALLPAGDNGVRIRFRPVGEPKRGPNRMHFDLTSDSLDDQGQTVARSLDLGARHIDVGQKPEEGHIVLADPEGNEFCVVEPGNRFLAGCGRIGALSCDGTRAVGYFWSAALDWPLVWDQDEETAIQSPRGGMKISWGGPPVNPRLGPNRVRLDLELPPGADRQAEIARLCTLGAAVAAEEPAYVDLTDPDGNEFRLR